MCARTERRDERLIQIMINDFRLSGCGFLVVVGHCAIDDLLKMTHKIIIFFSCVHSTTTRIMHNFLFGLRRRRRRGPRMANEILFIGDSFARTLGTPRSDRSVMSYSSKSLANAQLNRFQWNPTGKELN